VVWLDAHGDFNTPAITISGYLGGMALAMLTGRAPGLFGETLGLRPVADTDISDQATREAITRLAGALGTDLAWQVTTQN
jgi:arginase family enzyme